MSGAAEAIRKRVAGFIREHELIPPGGRVTCLVSGGQDSTCLWHVLGKLGYDVRAVHVAHGLRGEESEADAAFCRDVLRAEVLDGRPGRTAAGGSGCQPQSGSEPPRDAEFSALGASGRQQQGLQPPSLAVTSETRDLAARATEEGLRELRYRLTAGLGLRATGHTASDDAETVLFRLVARAELARIEPRRADGVVRPLLPLWRDETEAYCRAEGLAFRIDSSNPGTARGLIRGEILPLLRRLHSAAEPNLLAAAARRQRLPRRVEDALLSLLASREGSQRIDLGAGVQAVREYDRLWLEQGPVPLAGTVRWGPWTIRAEEPGLHVRGWRAGDRLSGRSKKVQDVFVDAKVPRSEREAWPLVVRGDEVVAVPGIVDAPGISAVRDGEGGLRS